MLEILAAAPLSARVKSRGLGPLQPLNLKQIIDGDSLRLQGGRELRLVGINAPEWNEAGGAQAKDYVRARLKSVPPSQQRYRRCELQVHDRYDRLLGFVELSGKDLQEELLRAGLVLPMVIEPCGRLRLHEYQHAAAAARRTQKGLWKHLLEQAISADEIARAESRYWAVHGVIHDIHPGRKAVYVNFSKDWKSGFSVHVSKRDWRAFESMKLHAGQAVTVFGYLETRRGFRMQLYDPAQIE